MNLRRSAILICALLVLTSQAFARDLREDEIRLGKEASIDMEKECKILNDDPELARVQRLGAEIAAIANKISVSASYGKPDITPFDYTFKIVDDETVNAFSLPGGYIYVNKGLLDYVQSDHELAGVLAHEVAHASHHHMTQLLKSENKSQGQMAILLLAGILSGLDSEYVGNLMIGAQLVSIATTSGYGQKAEADADATAVVYMKEAGLNPVGMLTFLERLAADYTRKPSVDMGIMQTHPAPLDRCRSVATRIRSMHLPINRRDVTKNATALAGTYGDEHRVEVAIDDKTIFRPAAIGSLTAEDRAAFIAIQINRFLDTEPSPRDVTVSADGKSVLLSGCAAISVTDEDCALHGKSAREVANEAASAIRQTVWTEMVMHDY
jgi:hypothetical protein